MKKQTLKITLSAMFLALAIIIPRIFHIFPGSGGVFLPMHIPGLLCGFVIGWQYGFAVGLAAPILNCLISGMPVMAKVPYMTAELATYGLCAGLFYVTLNLRKLKIGSFPVGAFVALAASLVVGRVVYALSLILALYAFGVSGANPLAVIDAFVTGIPGVVIQLVLIPVLLEVMEKTHIFKDLN
jgi:niacin transporter